MRIRISHPAFVDDLVRFLERMGFAAVECDYNAVRVDLSGKRAGPEARAQLQLYIQVWQATHHGVTATFEAGAGIDYLAER